MTKTGEDEMITVWVWWNNPENAEHAADYPSKVLYWYKDGEGQRWKSLRTDLDAHPMCKEIIALANLAGYDPDYPEGDVSEDFTIPAEWWGNPKLLNKRRDDDD